MQTVLRFFDRDHAWSAVLIGMLISAWVIYTDEVINSDGIVYVESARLFLEQGWQAGYERFHWPFFSLLIIAVSKLLFINFEHAGYVLNTTLLGLLAFMFVRCASELGGDKRVTLAAAILLLTSITLNEFRDLIVRDFGYLAFSFTSLWFLLKYKRTKVSRYAIATGCALIVATLFRVEGIVFIILAPLILFLGEGRFFEKFKGAVLIWTPAIAIMLIALLLMIFWVDVNNLSSNKLAGSLVYIDKLIYGLSEGIIQKAEFIEQSVLNYNSRGLGVKSVIAIIITIILDDIISTTGYLVIGLIAWAGFRCIIQKNTVNISVPLWFIIINLIIITGFAISQFFIVSRYVLYFSLLLSLLAAFPLAEILSKAPNNYKVSGKIRIFIIVVLSYMFLDGITSTSSDKAYIRDAASWLEKNAVGAKILSNEENMYYYTGRYIARDDINKIFKPTRLSKIPDINTKPYDYIIMKVGRKQIDFKNELIVWIGKNPVYTSKNKRNASILIFDVRK